MWTSRAYRPGDGKQLEQLKCCGHPYPRYARRVQQIVRRKLPPALSDPARSLMATVAVLDGTNALVGVVACEPVAEVARTWNIWVLGVSVDHQGHGIGSSLFAHALANCAVNGAESAVFEVSMRNDVMIRVAEKFNAVLEPHPEDSHHLLGSILLAAPLRQDAP